MSEYLTEIKRTKNLTSKCSNSKYCYDLAPNKFSVGHTEERTSSMSSKNSPFRRPKGKGGTKSVAGIDEGALENRKSQFAFSRSTYNVDPHNNFVEVRIF